MAFHPLANLVDLHDGYRGVFRVQGNSLLLLQDAGKTYLIENRCPHMDAPLANGEIKDGNITCRAHGIRFGLADGQAQGPLASMMDCLHFFELIYEGNKVGVNLP